MVFIVDEIPRSDLFYFGIFRCFCGDFLEFLQCLPELENSLKYVSDAEKISDCIDDWLKDRLFDVLICVPVGDGVLIRCLRDADADADANAVAMLSHQVCV